MVYNYLIIVYLLVICCCNMFTCSIFMMIKCVVVFSSTADSVAIETVISSEIELPKSSG